MFIKAIKIRQVVTASIAAGGLVLALSGQAEATPISAASAAYNEYISLTVSPLLGLAASVTSGPLATASGTAPGAYSDSDSLLTLNIANLVTTGLLVSNASSNLDGTNGSKYASADATVNGLGLSILGSLPGLSVLNLSATTIQSTASISGDYGSLAASGGTTIEGLSLNGITILDLSPPANNVLLDLLGIRVVLNEQIISGDGISSKDFAVNALHVSFENVLGLLDGTLGLINGDIIIGHSEASMMAGPTTPNGPGPSEVPAPASLLLLGMGLLSLGCLRRRLI